MTPCVMVTLTGTDCVSPKELVSVMEQVPPCCAAVTVKVALGPWTLGAEAVAMPSHFVASIVIDPL